MKRLQHSFKKYGNLYTQIKRTETKALYIVSGDGVTQGFEVIRIRVSPAAEFELNGVPQSRQAMEKYPVPEKFGTDGWFFMEKDNAEAKYESI